MAPTARPTARPTIGTARKVVAGALGAATAVITALAPVAASADTLPTLFVTTADAYVSASNPSTRYGSAKHLNADGSPERVILLRFIVTGAPAGPQHTILRLRQSTAQALPPLCDEPTECWHYVRVSVRSVGSAGWDESTTYATAPPTGPVLAAAPAVKVRGYQSVVDIDLGPLVDGDGTYDLAVTSDTTTNYTFTSREAGSPAQLILAP